jgi:ABC-type uncharacterized transport system YnjBCD permease subunit
VLVFRTALLLWNAAALPGPVAATLQRERRWRAAGYTPAAWWCRVGWMQWLPRLAWPLLAVLAYGLTVVDLALIVGPGSPPTLAVLAWQDLSDADPQRNAQGSSAALLLALLLALLVGLAWLGWHALLPAWRRLALSGRRGRVALAPKALRCAASGTGWLLLATYGGVLLSLLHWRWLRPWLVSTCCPLRCRCSMGNRSWPAVTPLLLRRCCWPRRRCRYWCWPEAAPSWDRWDAAGCCHWCCATAAAGGLHRQALELPGQPVCLAWVHLLRCC